MPVEKNFNTRIGLKIDTLENWGKSTLPLKKGEVAFATAAYTAGTGLTEPVVMMKIGEDGVKTFSQIEWNFYAKASDVLSACKSEDALKTFVNGVIADAGIATSDAMEALAKRVTTLEGDETTAGSVAKAIKDAIDALDLADTYVAIEDGKSLVDDEEITKLAGVSAGANKVEASETNGNIKVDGAEVTVYTHPEKHAIDDVTGLQDAINDAKKAGTDAQDALGDYQESNDEALADEVQARKDGDEAINDKIGAVAENKTVVEMITDAQAAATYDDTAVRGLITAEAERAADVEESLQTQINTIMNNPDTEGVINSINEFAQYVTDHGTIAEGMRQDINQNKLDIAAANKALSDHETLAGNTYETKTDASAKLTEAKGYTDTAKADVIGKAEDEASADTVKGAKKYADGLNTTMDGRVKALEEINHDAYVAADTALKTELQKEIDDDVAALANGAVAANTTAIEAINDDKTGILKQATDYADGLAKNYATAEQGGKADTALQEITTTENGGLKVTNKNQIDFDENVVFVFDCGDSGVNA